MEKISTVSSGTPTWSAIPTQGLQINSVAVSADGTRCICGTSEEYNSGQFGVFCYNGDGTPAWSAAIGPANSYQGVFWVGISGNGQYAAAGGELAKSNAGFLTAYSTSDGTRLLNATSSARYNQVALSVDGTSLLAVFDDTVQLYTLGGSGYTLTSSQVLAGAYCNSCALSDDGSVAVVSVMVYPPDDSAGTGTSTQNTGQVVTLAASGGVLTVSGTWNAPVGSMRVAMAASGMHWAASMHDGSCALFDAQHVTEPLWTFTPSVTGLGLAYGLDLTETSDGRIVLACGANVTQNSVTTGYLYVVDAAVVNGERVPKQRWSASLQYSANPGVSLDRDAIYVTATDGEPSGTTESPGNFYLYSGANGSLVWSYPTAIMNWPMVITPDASTAFGGSDTGGVYYWKLPAR